MARVNSDPAEVAQRPLALVFGGSRGIGQACVAALEHKGYHVLYTYQQSAAEPLVSRHISAYCVDITDDVQVAQLFAEIEQTFEQPLQCVVANAGINMPPAPLEAWTSAQFRALMEVNLLGAFHMLSHTARHVQAGASVIAITTSMVRLSVPGAGPYTASKAAVESLVRTLAAELGPRGVRINAVAPGAVDTALFHQGKTDAQKQKAASMSPFGRIGTTEEVAAVVAFFASDAASWVHGQIIQPNGGAVSIF